MIELTLIIVTHSNSLIILFLHHAVSRDDFLTCHHVALVVHLHCNEVELSFHLELLTLLSKLTPHLPDGLCEGLGDLLGVDLQLPCIFFCAVGHDELHVLAFKVRVKPLKLDV